MTHRQPGYYWINWTHMADEDLASRKPGPHIAHWDGRVWWFLRTDVYRFDSEVAVLGPLLEPPHRDVPPLEPAFLSAVRP